MKRICDNCGATAHVKEQMYSLKLEMYARAEPIVITQEDLETDLIQEMEKVLDLLATADADEASDQVHESYMFDLCSRCRSKFHRLLKSRASAK
jgi:hypothetical protein